jgi:hypothetical protein
LLISYSVVSSQPDVHASQIASLVDVADRGKPTLNGIAVIFDSERETIISFVLQLVLMET